MTSRGSLLWPAIAAVSTLVLADPALAEVCDKERPLWRRGDPAGLWSEVQNAIANPFVAFAVMASAVSALLMSRTWWIVFSLPLLAICMAAALDRLTNSPADQIDIAARHEGCIGPAWVLPVFLCLTVAAIALARRFARR